MINTSVFVSFFKALFSAFSKSVTYNVILKIINFFGNVFAASHLFGIIKKAGEQLCRESSYFYKLIKKITANFFAFAKKALDISKSGITYKVLKFLFGESFIFNPLNFLMLGIFVMFVCPHQVWNNVYGLMLAFACVVFYFIAYANNQKVGTNSDRLWLPLILFFGAVVLSVLISYDLADSIRVLMFFVTALLLCTLVYGFITSSEKFDKICFVIFMALVVTGIVAIVQKILGVEVDELLTDTHLNENMPGRVFSTWANPNNFAEFLIIFFPFCFSYAITRENAKWKTLAIFMLLIPFVALLFTYSRSGWLGFAVVAITFAVLYNKKLLPALVIIGILAVPLLPESVLSRIMTIGNLSDSSSSYRIDIWTGTIKMIKDYWYCGVGLGPGAFSEIYPSFATLNSAEAPHTHMLFMEVWAEMGIIGIICFAALIICLVVKSCLAAKKCESGRIKLYTVSAAASMMGILTIGFAEYVWFYPRVMFAFFIAIGMAMAAVKLSGLKNN